VSVSVFTFFKECLIQITASNIDQNRGKFVDGIMVKEKLVIGYSSASSADFA